MDPLTHSLAGTLISRSAPKLKRGMVLACFLGAIIPDIDILLTLGGHHLYLMEHRGFTHSLLGLIPMSLLASGVVWWLLRGWNDRASFGNLFLMALLGVLSHLYLDWCTSWGTMLLWPLRKRFALDQLFIIDLWYAGLFAIPLVLSSFFKEQRARICQVGLLGVALYHGLAAYEHHHALKIAE